MRQPSFTKRGPGRRPAHVNKLLAAALPVAHQALSLAKADKAKGGVGLAFLYMGGKAYPVWHDEHIGYRDGMITQVPLYGEASKRKPGPSYAKII